MNTYEEAKRILAELSLENIALRRQVNRLETTSKKEEPDADAEDEEQDESHGLGLKRPGKEEDTLEAKARQFAAMLLRNSPSLVHFFSIVSIVYLCGYLKMPFWLLLVVAVPWLEIIKSTDSERLANNIVIERYLRRLLVVDDDQYTIGDTAAWLNRAMVRLWPKALEPMISGIILDNVQFIFDDFLKTQSVIKRLKVESVSLGEVPIRILRMRTSLPEEHVAVTKKKAGKSSSKKFKDFSQGVYSDEQHMAFDHLLQAFQSGSKESRVDIDLDFQFVPSENMRFELSAGLHEKLPFFLHLSKLSLEGTVRLRLSHLSGLPPYVGMLGITLPTLPDLDFQIRPVSKLLGDITQMPLINQIGDLVRGALTVLALPNVLEVPLAEMSAEEPDEEAAAVKIVNVDTGLDLGQAGDKEFGEEPKVKLNVEVLRAYNLAEADRNLIGANTSDPFVTISVAHKRAKTKVKRRTCNPRWNESFTFLLQNLEKPVKFSVWDHDLVGKNTLLGTATVDLEALFDGSAHMVELDLSSVEFGQRGTLHVSLEMFDLGLYEDESEDEKFEEVEEVAASQTGGLGVDKSLGEKTDSAEALGTTRRESNALQMEDIKAALEEDSDDDAERPQVKQGPDEVLPKKVSIQRDGPARTSSSVKSGSSSPQLSPSKSQKPSRTLSRQSTMARTRSIGTYTGPLKTWGGYFRNQIKER